MDAEGDIMGKEIEYKFALPEGCDAKTIFNDWLLNTYRCSPWQERHMKTTYFDSDDCRFSKNMCTLRHRMEGEEGVVCIKTPTNDSHTRGEWQVNADTLDKQSIERLIFSGAPKQLLVLYGSGDVSPICGAEFIRTSAMLTFSDGSEAEFAHDKGILHGKTEQQPLEEIELELYNGSPEEMLTFVKHLCEAYGLEELKYSKFARARALK